MKRFALLWAVAICAGCYAPPPDNAFSGSTKQQIIEKLGAPTSQFDGHYGIPGSPWEYEHPNCVTLVYKKSGGTLFVTLEPKNGEWIGLWSEWLPDGAVF